MFYTYSFTLPQFSVHSTLGCIKTILSCWVDFDITENSIMYKRVEKAIMDITSLYRAHRYTDAFEHREALTAILTECTDAGYISAEDAEYLQEVFSCGVTWDMESKHDEDIKKANKEYHEAFNTTYGRVNLMGHRLCSPDDEEQKKFTEFLFKFGSDTFRRVAQFPNREAYYAGRRG